MAGRNSKGRGKVFRVGDMKKDEAMQYLKAKGIKDEEKEHVFNLLGGRMIDLTNFTSELNKGVSFAGNKQFNYY